MLLQFATWPEIEARVARSPAIVVPIGSTEQHGPSGLIGTDALCAEAIAVGLAREHDVLVAPTIALGAAQFNLAFPGTISVRATTLIAIVIDVIGSLARQGFTHFYFLNGHGGNIAPVRSAFQDLYADYSLAGRDCPIRMRLRSWWEYPNADQLRKQLFGDAEGMHATPSEIAITQYVHPATVRASPGAAPPRLSAAFLRDHAGDQHLDAKTHRREFPDGRVGSDSGLAQPDHGRVLLDAAVADAWADVQTFLSEPR